MPNLPGPHQIQNAGAAIAALRALGRDEAACEAAVTRAFWPARMQRLRHGPLVDLAPKVELWLDGGHNPAGGEAVAATLARMPKRETHLICGMLNTKDVAGYMAPLAPQVTRLHAVSIPRREEHAAGRGHPRCGALSRDRRGDGGHRWPKPWPGSPP